MSKATKEAPNGKSKELKGEVLFLSPNEITINPQDRGRAFAPTQARVDDMVNSLLDVGQIQPIVCRLDGKTKVLTLGFTRHEAAAKIVAEKDPNFKLKVIIANINADQGFIANCIENAERNETSAIDDAHNQNRLRDRNGFTDAQIARMYGMAPATILKYKRLLQLPDSIQKEVHFGKLSVDAAVDILDLPEADRAAVLEESVKNSGKYDGAKIKARVRDHVLATSPAPETPVQADPEPVPASGDTKKTGAKKPKKAKAKPEGKFKPRSMKELKTFLDTQRTAEKIPEKRKKYLDTFKLWLAGQRMDATLVEALENL